MIRYSVIMVATGTEAAGRYDYAAYHLEGEGGRLSTRVYQGSNKHDKFWTRTIHFTVDDDMVWGVLSDRVDPPYCWTTSSEVWVSPEIGCDDVANEMLDIARAVAWPEDYLAWVRKITERECQAVKGVS